MIVLAPRDLFHWKTILKKERRKRQSLFNSHRQSRWITVDLDPQLEELFNRRFNQYRWTKIREKLGLHDFTFHDLRKTFGSVLAQKGVSTAVVQRLLEHSSSDLTNKVYTNVDPVLRHAVDQIPAGDWL